MRRPGEGRFSADWLSLRATYDVRARHEALLRLFVEALGPQPGELRLIDLGCGTAANFLHLAPRLADLVDADQRWLLIDHDPKILDRASERIAAQARANGWELDSSDDSLAIHAGDRRWSVGFCRLDLAHDLEAMEIAEGDAVVLSALLDLVSPAWLQRLVDLARENRLPMLATLTYDGSLDWQPHDQDDARIRALFNDHQRRDKGFGPALGPAAPSWLAARVMAAGFTVEQRPSPWRLGPEDLPMLNALIESVSDAAAEQDPQARRVAAAWATRRKAQAAAGVLSATVGHVDLLATP